jgi:hypothetical protein
MESKTLHFSTYHISPRKEFPPHILRLAKRVGQKSRINSKAKSEQNQRPDDLRPVLRLKRKAGAPKGSRNALKHGLYSGALIGLKRRARLAIANLKLATAQVKLQAAEIEADAAIKRRAEGPALAPLAALPALTLPGSACLRMR